METNVKVTSQPDACSALNDVADIVNDVLVRLPHHDIGYDVNEMLEAIASAQDSLRANDVQTAKIQTYRAKHAASNLLKQQLRQFTDSDSAESVNELKSINLELGHVLRWIVQSH